MVQAGTVPGSLSGSGSVVVTGVVLVVESDGVDEVDRLVMTVVVVAATASPDGSGLPPRVIRNTAKPSTNPAATIVITWPARSFTSFSYAAGAQVASPVSTGRPWVSI
jgi:hypothetical protein